MFQNYQMHPGIPGPGQPGWVDYWSQLASASQGWGGFPYFGAGPPQPIVLNQNPWIQPVYPQIPQHQPLWSGNVESVNNYVQPEYNFSGPPAEMSTQREKNSQINKSRWSQTRPRNTCPTSMDKHKDKSMLSTKVDKMQTAHKLVEKKDRDELIEEKDLEVLPIYKLRMKIDRLKIPMLFSEEYSRKFSDTFDQFLTVPDPVPLLTKVVVHLFYCSQHKPSIRSAKNHIDTKLGMKNEELSANLKMRTFWVLAEVYRHEYDSSFKQIRPILNSNILFMKFLNRNWKNVHRTFEPELRAIWNYWKKFAPKYMIDNIPRDIPTSCKNYLSSNGPIYSSMERFYELCKPNRSTTFKSSEEIATPTETTRTHVENSKKTKSAKKKQNKIKKKTTAEERHSLAPSNNLTSETRRSISPSLPSAVKPTCVKASRLTESERAVKLFSSKLDTLFSINSLTVPLAASDVLFQILDFGTDNNLAEKVIKLLNEYVFGKQSKNFVYQKIIRIFWVIGNLFSPKYKHKVTATRDRLEKTAPRLFSLIVKKFTEFEVEYRSAREEMRVIFSFWKDVMKPEMISAVRTSLCGIYNGKLPAKFNWVFDDKGIKKDAGISEFYSNTYLDKEGTLSTISKVTQITVKDLQNLLKPVSASTTSPTASNVLQSTDSIHKTSDDETEIVCLDKRDVIGQKNTNKNVAKEGNQQAKKPTNLIADQQLVKKRKIKKTEEDANLFSEVIILPSKPTTPSPASFQTVPQAKNLTNLIADEQHIRKKKYKKTEKDMNLFGEFTLLPSKPKPTAPSPVSLQRVENEQVGSKRSYPIVKDKTRVEHEKTFASTSAPSAPQQPVMSKLELFRKQMENNEAIKSVNYRWKEPIGGGKVKYLPQNWSVDEFVHFAFSDSFNKWDIVKLPNGESRIRMERK